MGGQKNWRCTIQIKEQGARRGVGRTKKVGKGSGRQPTCRGVEKVQAHREKGRLTRPGARLSIKSCEEENRKKKWVATWRNQNSLVERLGGKVNNVRKKRNQLQQKRQETKKEEQQNLLPWEKKRKPRNRPSEQQFDLEILNSPLEWRRGINMAQKTK